MTALAHKSPSEEYCKALFSGLLTTQVLDVIESAMLRLPQLEAPIEHRFCDGYYIREGTMPAGAVVLGHYHKDSHICVVLSGSFVLVNEDKTFTLIEGPCTFVGKPGRKLGVMLTDVKMQNLHPTSGWDTELFNNPDKREEHLYILSAAFREFRLNKKEICL